MQRSVLFAYCSGRNFNDTDLPLLSTCMDAGLDREVMNI